MVYRVTLCLFLAFSPLSFSGEVEIMRVDDIYPLLHQSMPRNLCNVMSDAEISLISPKGKALEGDPYCLIDPDRSSGLVFPSNSSQTFLLNLKSISQLKKITLTGDLQGARVTVEVMDKPTVQQITWKTIVSNQPLHSPVTAIPLRTQEVFQAKITVTTGKAQTTLNDIAFFSDQDMRTVEIQKNPNLTVKQTPQGFKVQEPPTIIDNPAEMGVLNTVAKQPQNQFDLGSLYAGTRISHITPLADAREAYYLNDDDPDTCMDLPSEPNESIAVLDLGESRRVREFSMVHSDPDVELVIYVVDQLPWSEPSASAPSTDVSWMEDPMWTANGWMSDIPLFAQVTSSKSVKSGKIVKINTSIFSSIKPFANISLSGKKFSRVKGTAVKGRFVILLFKKKTPSNPGGTSVPPSSSPNKEASVAKNVNITDVPSLLSGDNKIRIFQVSIFGDVPLSFYTFTPKARVDPTLDALVAPSKKPKEIPSEDSSDIDSSKVDNLVRGAAAPPPSSGSNP